MGDPRMFHGEDDTEYLGWLHEHPRGLVVNGLDETGRNQHPSYPNWAVLHESGCSSIGGHGERKGRVESYTGRFPKACWETRQEFDEWSGSQGSPRVKPSCPGCRPDSERP